MTVPRKPPSIAAAVLGVVLFLGAAAASLPTIIRAITLKFDGAVTQAMVTDTELRTVSTRSINSPYLVQYRFQASDSESWHTDHEAMIVGKPMAEVSADVWNRAKQTGRIQVIYSRHDPDINLPYPLFALSGILCPSIAGGFCLILALLNVLVLIGRIMYRRKLDTPAPEA